LAQAVQQGYLGDVFHVRTNVPWSRQDTYFSGAAWHASLEQSGGGTLLTQGSHFLDIVLWALGQKPVSVEGMIRQVKFKDVEVEDQALGLVTFERGTTLQIHSTMAAAVEGSVSIEVYGEKGTARYTNRPFPKVRFIGVKPPAFRLPRFGIHALQRSLIGFCDWVLAGTPYLTPIEQALPVLAVTDAIYQSAASGEKIKISISAIPS
jgi:predicted dehydrogenase